MIAGPRLGVRRLATASGSRLVESSLDASTRVLTLRFNNPKKLNAWTKPMMTAMQDELARAKADDSVGGVVVTGTGKYYSAGVDLSSTIRPMAPSTLIRTIRDQNEKLFRLFIDFPKPIVAAVNGPAIGAAVTSTILMDRVISSESATFSLPFARLSIPPEGCSSVTWPERMGEANAQRMMGPEAWVPTAEEALAAGLIDEIVSGDDAGALEARAIAYTAERVTSGVGRRFDAAEQARLIRVNAEESARLANAFVSPAFLSGMHKFNAGRKKAGIANFFWLAKVSQPLWRPAEIAPSYSDPS